MWNLLNELNEKTLVGATTAVLVGAAGAGHAADLYAPPSLKDGAAFVPAPVWTGFYFGANIGSAWSSIELGRERFATLLSRSLPLRSHLHSVRAWRWRRRRR